MLLRSAVASGALASAILLGLLTATPGHAATIGATGNWSSDVADEPTPPSALISFSGLMTNSPGTGFLAGYSLDSIGDLPLVSIGGTIYGVASDFDGGSWKVYSNGSGDQVSFDLNTDATWNRFFDPGDNDASWTQIGEYSGTYTLPDGSTTAGTGFLNMSSSGDVNERAKTFQLTQQGTEPQPIPLPASAWFLLGASGFMGYIGRKRARKPCCRERLIAV